MGENWTPGPYNFIPCFQVQNLLNYLSGTFFSMPSKIDATIQYFSSSKSAELLEWDIRPQLAVGIKYHF
jgi:hypothetical protein